MGYIKLMEYRIIELCRQAQLSCRAHVRMLDLQESMQTISCVNHLVYNNLIQLQAVIHKMLEAQVDIGNESLQVYSNTSIV